jgi:hypothetical protein
MNATVADVLVIVHLIWVLFMVGGVVVTTAGLFWPRLLNHSGWRLVHLIGLLFAGWLSLVGRLCPLTALEYALRRMAGEPATQETGFIIRLANSVIFPNLDQTTLSAVTVVAGLLVLGVCLWRPPWHRIRTPK